MLYSSTYSSDDFLLLCIRQEAIGILENGSNTKVLDLDGDHFILVSFFNFINDF